MADAEHQWDVRDARDGHLLQYVWGTREHAEDYAQRHFGDRPTEVVHGDYCHGCPDGLHADPCDCEAWDFTPLDPSEYEDA